MEIIESEVSTEPEATEPIERGGVRSRNKRTDEDESMPTVRKETRNYSTLEMQ